MTEREAFLRKIVEQPGEDAHRLVFADWLDEHVETERASHLRRPGAWFIISASFAGTWFGGKYPVEQRRRYLVWWPAVGPAVRAEDRDPVCVAGRVWLTYPRGWSVRCHCGRTQELIEFTGGTWHCSTCPPTESGRKAWEDARDRRIASVMEELLGSGTVRG